MAYRSFQELEVSRDIVLHKLRPDHAEQLYARVLENRAHLRAWLPWVDNTRSIQDSYTFIELAMTQDFNKNGFHCAIVEHDFLCGVIGLHRINHACRVTSIGYWLSQSHEGKGVMTRCCRALIRYLFEELGMNRIEINCATENLRSQAIPERLGFTKEGLLRDAEWLYDHYVDHYIYSLLRREWNETPEK